MVRKCVLLCGVAAMLAPVSAAMAQEVEEIVVTAQKREESLQDVPVSVLATSGETITSMAITNARELTSTLPAVKVALSPIGNFVFIRGIGTPGINQGMEQSVSIFHDGIYMGRSQLSRAPFLDVERVEVLRGPQSILFGKNTIGGAIHVIDKKPTQDFEAEVNGLYGSFDERELTGVVSGGITDGVAARVSFRKYDMDGYLDNVMTGKDAGGRDEWTLRGQLAIDPTETTSINLKWEHSQFDSGEQTTQLAVFNPFNPRATAFNNLNKALVAAGTGGTGIEEWDRERAVINDGGALLGQVVPSFAGLAGFPDLKESSHNKMDLGSINIDQEIGDATLTLTTGYAQYKYRDICDCDFSALPLIQVDAREKYEQYSQEIRLTSPKGVPVEYIVGGYYQHSKLNYRAIDSFGSAMAYGVLGLPTPLLLPNVTRDYSFDQKQNLWAVFGQGTWNATETTRATLGLRWFKDSKTGHHTLNKSFTDGWDYSAVAGLPAGSIAFGNTPEEYDRFLASGFGATQLDPVNAPLVTPAYLTEALFGGLLGTQEHDIRRKRSEDKLNWNITVEHDFADDVMAYATVSTGTKGGGFDARYLRDSANTGGYFDYEPENATNYEVGIKSKLFNNSVRLNLAAFRVDVKDFQVSAFDGATAFFVINGAKARSQGIEFDATWAATDNLTFNASGSILDAKWRDFPEAPCWQSPPTENRGNCIVSPPPRPDGTIPLPYRDASGARLSFAPKFASFVNAVYKQPIGDTLEGGLALNLAYSSGFFNGEGGDSIYNYQKKNAKIDARISLGHVDSNWEVAFLAKNLTNQLTSFNSNNQPLVPGNGFRLTDRPRSYAVQARFAF